MKRILVLRGGPSTEHAVSLKTGGAVLRALADMPSVHTKDVVISKDGEWIESGIKKDPEQTLLGVDAVFIALHGKYGEDGQVQRFLEAHGVPYTGSAAMSSALAYNKIATKHALKDVHLVTTPKHMHIKGDSLWSVAGHIENIIEHLGTDIFIKPVAEGSSNDAFRAHDKDSLENVLDLLLPRHGELLIEEAIMGREATVGVLEEFRGEEHYALPVVEIVPPKKSAFYSNEAKYGGETELICPGRFTYEEKQKMADMAIAAHKALGCSQYSRSDFLVRDGEIFFLEINSLPGFTEHSLFPKAARTIGLEFGDLVSHLLNKATV